MNLDKSIIVIACFLAYKYSKYAHCYLIFGKENWENWPTVILSGIMLLTGMIMGFTASYLLTKKLSLQNLGIGSNGFIKGLVSASLFCLPMFIILGFIYDFNFQPTLEILYNGIIIAGFGEEFIYRAFLFGLLFHYSGWGFLSAGIFTGLFFGAGHLYQADNISDAISIFLFTTGVSVGFVWFYIAWKNIWMITFLHGFMDVIWDSYHVDANVTGSLWVNVARFSTIVIAILYSIKIAKKNNVYSLKNKLWINKSVHQPS